MRNGGGKRRADEYLFLPSEASPGLQEKFVGANSPRRRDPTGGRRGTEVEAGGARLRGWTGSKTPPRRRKTHGYWGF